MLILGGVSFLLQNEITERHNEDDAIRNDLNNESFTRAENDAGLQNSIDSINNRIGQPYGIAELGVDGKLPTSQLPALAVTDVYTVNSQAAQLALTAEEGDVCVRTDLNKTYIHNGGTTGTMADWQEMLTPTDTVLSVNGQTGAVNLTTTNIAEGSNLYFTTARVLATVLSGLSAAAGSPASTDTILQAMGKVKYFIDNIASTILGQVLTGFAVAGSYTAITATDTISTAFGKIQKRFNNLGDSADKNTGTTAGTVAAGDDSRFTDARTPKLLVKSIAPVSGSNTTSEEVLKTLQIPSGQITTGDILEIFSQTGFNANGNGKTIRYYLNTTPDLSGSPVLIATSATNTSIQSSPFQRYITVAGDTSIRVPAAASIGLNTNYVVANSPITTITVPSLSVGPYLVITTQKVISGTDTIIIDSCWIRRQS